MYQKKNFVKVIVFSVISCGIYGIYFLYKYDKELNGICTHTDNLTMEYLLAFVLSIPTCGLFMFYWYYTIYSKEANEAAATGAVLNIKDPLVMSICMIIPFFGIYLLCDNFNKLLDAAGKTA